jgi:upstream activation factor subunit UAF30
MIGSRSHVAVTGREQHLRRCGRTKRSRRRTYDSAPSGRRFPPTPVPHTSRSTTIVTKPTAAKPEGKKRAPNPAFAKPMTISPVLAAVVGADPIPRTEVTKRLWDYIKAHKLQDEQNRRLINADDKLFAVFDKRQVTMFEMTKLVNAHLS